jgi:beta-glucosidase
MKISSSNWSRFFLICAFVLPGATAAAQTVRAQLRPAAPKLDAAGETRIDNLLSRLTLDEKISLISGLGFETAAIPRLQIPAFNMTDGPAG